VARWTPWMPLALGVALVGGVVALSRFAAERVDQGLRGVVRRLPDPPDLDPTRALVGSLPGEEPIAGEAADDGGGDDEPRLDLEHPTERDWRFLEQTLREGTPEARRSAARALVVAGGMRGVAPLFAAAAEPGQDADLFCLAALDILRMQRWEDALPALLAVMLEDERPTSQACRSEVADRFAVAGGRDPARVATFAVAADPQVRAFVAGFLSEVAPDGYKEALDRLAEDPDPSVRARVRSTVPAVGEDG